MQKQCVIVQRRHAGRVPPALVENYGFLVQEIDGDALDERDVLSIIEEQPFAIILPLSLPRYTSLRFAELIALSRCRTRLILISGTNAPPAVIEQLFDRFLGSSAEGLIEALCQPDWVHSFERRSTSLDAALQEVLRAATCFWLSGERHPEMFATLVDYQRSVAESTRHFKILFLASDPTDAARLRLMKEFSEIENELARRSEHSFSMKLVFSSRPDELARRLLEERPHIVHFSGHGDADGRLCFETASGQTWVADQAAIAQMFEPCRRYVKCVVLNACFSAHQAELIGVHAEYAIGLTSSVSDAAAIALAKGFYGAFSATGRISSALDAARGNLRLVSGEQAALHCTKRISRFGRA